LSLPTPPSKTDNGYVELSIEVSGRWMKWHHKTPGFGAWASKFALWAWQTLGLHLGSKNLKYRKNTETTLAFGFNAKLTKPWSIRKSNGKQNSQVIIILLMMMKWG